jgi:hypothetical protein
MFSTRRPRFHNQLESRNGKIIFAPRRKLIAKLDYAEESRTLVSWFDATPVAIQTSKTASSRSRTGSVATMTWVLPDFSHPFYGASTRFCVSRTISGGFMASSRRLSNSAACRNRLCDPGLPAHSRS